MLRTITKFTIIAGAVVLGAVPARADGDHDDVCVVGYIMDNYCINRGTLLDNQSVKTLEGPDQHSIHCLVDVPWCVDSGFEVLVDPPAGASQYCRGLQLDGPGQDMAIALARETGSRSGCSTCVGGADAAKKGFRATIKGKLTKDPTSESPGSIQVTSVEPASVGCGDDNYMHPFCSIAAVDDTDMQDTPTEPDSDQDQVDEPDAPSNEPDAVTQPTQPTLPDEEPADEPSGGAKIVASSWIAGGMALLAPFVAGRE